MVVVVVDDEHLSLWQFIVLLNVLLYISRIRFLHSGRKSLPSDQQWPTLCHSDLHSVHSDLNSVQYCISVLILVSATIRTSMYNLYKTNLTVQLCKPQKLHSITNK